MALDSIVLDPKVSGHGVIASITDHRDVKNQDEQKNHVLLFNSGSKKYENKEVLRFDETTDEFIIGLN